ncbi:hypothetical protein K0M31_008374 [Melipona bicolor]|uniref:Uncharacterized protein n=1 Tax=Melipona bicolor TaxID=60889 RepID=A0AA40FR67_9HYME|nr:hypothetical protein K0M31_008374 [Melipona bicolor]
MKSILLRDPKHFDHRTKILGQMILSPERRESLNLRKSSNKIQKPDSRRAETICERNSPLFHPLPSARIADKTHLFLSDTTTSHRPPRLRVTKRLSSSNRN